MLETETGWDWLLWYVNSISFCGFKAQAELTTYFSGLELFFCKLDTENSLCFNYFLPLNWETDNKPVVPFNLSSVTQEKYFA